MKKAIVFGSTGFIGSHVLNNLLNRPDYEQVTVVVRRPLTTSHPRLKILLGDFDSLPGLQSDLVADEVFIALGTTTKHTPRRDEYYRIDHDYPVRAAKLARENGARSVFVVTAVGADTGSMFFYVRTKGEVERDIIALDYQHTHIFQPSMIVGDREEERTMEKFMMNTWTAVDPLLVGGMDRFKGIDGKNVARAMVNAASHPTDKVKIYRWREMTALL